MSTMMGRFTTLMCALAISSQVLLVVFGTEIDNTRVGGGGMCGAGRTSDAFVGDSSLNTTADTADHCCAKCDSDATCLAWTAKFPSGNCFLFSAIPTKFNRHPSQTCVSGTRFTPAPTTVHPTPQPVPAPPGALNVLMIAIDDMRPEMEPYGHTHMHTPNLQTLANRSILFSRAYVQVALCMPSRNALLFSRRPDTTKAWDIDPLQWPRRCGGSCTGKVCGTSCGIREQGPQGKLGVTLPGWFYQHGYYTVGAGKIFHEGGDTVEQDYQYSWTPSTTNKNTGLFEASGGPTAMYNGTKASPSWYAFDVDDEMMTETKLAQYGVDVIANLSKAESSHVPFFLAVGFHKPHVPWYAPKKYWDYYPNDTISIAPNIYKPEHGPNLAENDVVRGWSTPKNGKGTLSCKYTDLCGEIYPGAPFANGRPGISELYPYDNSTFPEWKAKEMRRAYWASLSYTDSNIGRVVDSLDASSFSKNTVIALWGDHGYALGDNANWAKQTNFEHATHIPFMIHVPGFKGGRSDALVEAIDLFPTLIEAATMFNPSGPTSIPACADTTTSRNTALCTEGHSLMTLIKNTSAYWGRASFSQFTRSGSCCDCRVGEGACCACDVPNPNSGDVIMGYTVRVDKYRYTAWFQFNASSATPNTTNVLATELYEHTEAILPVDWGVEHINVVSDPLMSSVVSKLHTVLVQCAPRPDLCPPTFLEGFVV